MFKYWFWLQNVPYAFSRLGSEMGEEGDPDLEVGF
jgi:hypothetical protein